MSASAPVLIAAAAGVGFTHAVLPDHWMPLAVVGRTERRPASRTARLALLAGVGHVGLSIALGAIVIAVGVEFSGRIQGVQNLVVGGLLVVTGLAFLALRGRGHHHHHHSGGHHHEGHDDHDHDGQGHTHHDHHRGRLAVLVPFGAAASPDLTILPVFLAAAAVSAVTAVACVMVFGAVTIGTFVVLTVAAAVGGDRLAGDWLERHGDLITGGVLVIIGGLVCAGVL